MAEGIWLRFLSGPEIACLVTTLPLLADDELGLTRIEIVQAVEQAVRDHGKGEHRGEPEGPPGAGRAGRARTVTGPTGARRWRVVRRLPGYCADDLL